MNIQRNRRHYLLLIIITIGLGLEARSALVPEAIYPYLGDFFYAIMIYFGIAFLFPKMKIFQIAFLSVLCCFLIEFSQLYQVPWIVHLRSYKLGGVILGYGFLWSDLFSYTLGGITGYILEIMFYKNKRKPLADM